MAEQNNHFSTFHLDPPGSFKFYYLNFWVKLSQIIFYQTRKTWLEYFFGNSGFSLQYGL